MKHSGTSNSEISLPPLGLKGQRERVVPRPGRLIAMEEVHLIGAVASVVEMAYPSPNCSPAGKGQGE